MLQGSSVPAATLTNALPSGSAPTSGSNRCHHFRSARVSRVGHVGPDRRTRRKDPERSSSGADLAGAAEDRGGRGREAEGDAGQEGGLFEAEAAADEGRAGAAAPGQH